MTVPELHKMMQESKNVLRAQIDFVVSILGPVHDAILVLQKDVGGILDLTKMLDKYAPHQNHVCKVVFLFHRFKRAFEDVAKGKVPPEVSKRLAGLSASIANNMRKEFQTAGSVCLFLGGLEGLCPPASLSGAG